jgi:hypothetical protein
MPSFSSPNLQLSKTSMPSDNVLVLDENPGILSHRKKAKGHRENSIDSTESPIPP